MALSRESRALRKCYEVFTIGVDPDSIIRKLYSSFLLTPEEKGRATQRTLTPAQQIEAVFDCLERRVATDSSVFHELVQVLLEEPALERVGKKMQACCEEEMSKSVLSAKRDQHPPPRPPHHGSLLQDPALPPLQDGRLQLQERLKQKEKEVASLKEVIASTEKIYTEKLKKAEENLKTAVETNEQLRAALEQAKVVQQKLQKENSDLLEGKMKKYEQLKEAAGQPGRYASGAYLSMATQGTSTELFRHHRPSITQLLEFPQESGPTNVIEQIGHHYRTLGPLLLDDDTGTITDDIARECQKNAYDINLEILKRWLRGSGITPVTWETLIAKLKSTRLTELARTIERILH